MRVSLKTVGTLALAFLLTAPAAGCSEQEAPSSNGVPTEQSWEVTGDALGSNLGLGAYETTEFGPLALPEDRGQYWENAYWFSEEDIPLVVPLTGDLEGKRVDRNGVLVVNWPGFEEPVYHPVALATYALYAFQAYELTGNEAYLERAEVNARALIDGAQEVEGALWFPYLFDHWINGDQSMTLEAPWYSGMAQGQALDLFSKLCSATGDPGWCEAADKTFGSFLQTDLPGQSFAWVDDNGSLWLEEYVGTVPFTQVINGHMYSAFGLAEYARRTGDELATDMFNGAATTMLQRFDEFRQPGGISFYCNAEYCREVGWQPENYHQGVARQFRVLGHLTDIKRFKEMQAEFTADYKEWSEAADG